MEIYKNNEEAAKAYADLLQLDTNTEQGKLQYESACLDFAAGANWKDEQLRLSNVSWRSELLISFSEYLHKRDLMNVVKENIPIRVKLFLKRN
jgi:hypothetical protein